MSYGIKPQKEPIEERILDHMEAVETELRTEGKIKGVACFNTQGLADDLKFSYDNMRHHLYSMFRKQLIHRLSQDSWALGRDEWINKVKCPNCGHRF